MPRSLLAQIRSLLASFAFRIALTALALMTPVAVLVSIGLGSEVNRVLAAQTFDVLRGELQVFRGELDRGGMGALAASVSARSVSSDQGIYLLTTPSNGQVPLAGNIERLPAGVTTSGNIFKFWRTGEQRFVSAAGLLVPLPDGGTLLVARRVDDQQAFARNLQLAAFAVVALLTMLSLALGWFFSRRANRRVADITTTARSIMSGDFTRRVPTDASGDELDELAIGLNAMLARIEELVDTLREVSDNIAHDLKTPLTRLRNRAEAALRDDRADAHREGLEKVIEESDGLIQTFNALLLIARLEAGAVDATRTRCDITALVRDVAELYQPVGDDAGLQIEFASDPTPTFFLVNRQLVGQAVANMLDNAIKYSTGINDASSGSITVKVVAVSDKAVEIAVADRGPGIPAADRERVTKRFVRLEQSRSRPGTGLGLSLVSAVARLHDGALRLEDNSPGLRVVLLLAQRSCSATSPISVPGGAGRVSQTASIAR